MNINTQNAMNTSTILSNYFNAYKWMIRHSQHKDEAKNSLKMLNTIYGTYEAMKDNIEGFRYMADDMERDRQECIKNHEYARTEAARNAAWVLKGDAQVRTPGRRKSSGSRQKRNQGFSPRVCSCA